MPWLDSLEKWHNRASDTRFVWFPFERFRPQRDEQLHPLLRLQMAIVFGLYYGAMFLLRGYFLGRSPALLNDLAAIGQWICVFFIWFNLVTAPLWNRRARRLTSSL